MITLRHFLDDFMLFVLLQMPQLLNVAAMEGPQFYGDYVLLTFPLRDSYDLEEIMDISKGDMGLTAFHHHVPVGLKKSGHNTCAYSNPVFGQMSRMNARTDADGRVNRIIVTIYDSLELMCGNLYPDLKLHAGNGSSKYKKSQEDVLLGSV